MLIDVGRIEAESVGQPDQPQDIRPRENPQRAEPSCCAAHCEAVFSTGRLRVLTRIEQPVEVDDEIAHLGVVHGLLRLAFQAAWAVA